MSRSKRVQYRKVNGTRVYTTTAEQWERLKSNRDVGRNFVLVKDLSEIQTISDAPEKPKRTPKPKEDSGDGISE